MKNKKGKKRGQIWIETVIYTLIAFSLIATVLAFVKPKIDEAQDKAVVEQSILIMKELDSIILSIIQGGTGNTRSPEIRIRDGILTVDGENDLIFFEIDSRYLYSELNANIRDGNLDIITKEGGLKKYKITITRNYTENINLTYKGEEKSKSLTKAGTSHKIWLANKGRGADNRWIIDVEFN